MATDLGKAYVQIMPSAQGIKAKIEEILGPVDGAGESAGKSLGGKLVAGLTAAISAAGIGKLIKSSLMEGANLQQSFGGLDTLYGDAAEAAKTYAREAYKAGISSNTYAEQAVSMGAALKQSLGGDSVKAAEAANMAILDMADNAAKMGTPIESLQMAYQGFAKQNYTMLDNLKIGYGGTKTEMERLLADAEKLTGVKYDINNLADVYTAIHTIQDNLNLTGVAAEEAKTTFSGSFGAMKAAAQNLLAGMSLGEDLTPQLQGLAETASTFFFDNFIPMVGNVLKSLPTVVGTLLKEGVSEVVSRVFGEEMGQEVRETLEKMGEALKEVVDWFTSGTPAADAFQGALVSIGTAFAAWKITSILTSLGGFSGILATVGGSIATFAGTVTAAISSIPLIGWIAAAVAGLVWFFTQTETGRELWSSFMEWAKGAWEDLKIFFANLWQGISEGATNLWNGVTEAWNGAIETLKGLWDGMVAFFDQLWLGIQATAAVAWQVLVQGIMAVVQPFIDGFMLYWQNMSTGLSMMWEGIKMMFQGAWEFIKAIFMGAVLIILDLVTGNFGKLKEDLSLIWESIKSAVSLVWEGIKTYLSGVVSAIVGFATTAFETFKGNLSAIWDFIKTAASNAWNWIKATVSSLIDGLVSGARATWEGFKSFLSGLWETIKSTAIGAWENLKSSVQNTIDNLVAGAQRAWDNLKQGVSDLVSRVTSIFDGLRSIDLWSAGSAIINGFLNGLKSAYENVKSFVGGIADWIRQNKGPISYDRKLLIPAGRAIMGGFNRSLMANFEEVKDTVRGMAPTLAGAMGTAKLDMGLTTSGATLSGQDLVMSHQLTAESSTAQLVNRLEVGLGRLEALLGALVDKDTAVYLDGEAIAQNSYRHQAKIMLREGF